VDIAFGEWQLGRLGRGGERGLAVLRRRPDLAALGRPAAPSRSSFPSSRVLVRIGVDGLDLARRRSEGRARIADLVADSPPAPASSPAFITAANLALDAVAFGPLSHSIGSASSALFACHQVSATTATAESPTRTTFLTPGRFITAAASTLLTLPPNTGQSLIAALSIPGA
jgi:hypothetical protein